ncbi:MAG: SRPBCC family protein [Acidobacteriota bacterium]|nr:MAG: SRPBCC family protein [Acidobacteriota bacterium]
MAIDVHSEILIERPPEKVAEVMFNPKMDKLWIRSLAEVFPMESGFYRQGAKIERVGDFMSKRYSAKVQVMKCDPGRSVELYQDEPFEMKQKYSVREAEGGTLARVSVSSIGELLFNSPVSILSKKLKENLDDDLKNLKKLVETG